MAITSDPHRRVGIASEALLLCRKVERDGAELSLLGVHDTRVVTKLPCRFEDLVAYLRFETDRPRSVPLRLELQPPGDAERVILGSYPLEVDDLRAELTVNLDSVEFREDGIHVFAFYTDSGFLVATTGLCVVRSDSAEASINVLSPGRRFRS